MRRRAERLKKALEVTDKIWRLQQIKLTQIDTELTRLRAAEQATLNSLSTLDPKLLLEHIARLAQRRQEMETARLAILTHAREYGRRMKLTEKLYSEAVEICRSEENAEQSRQSQRPVSSPS